MFNKNLEVMKRGMILTAVVLALGLSLPTATFAENSNMAVQQDQDNVKYDKIEVSELPEPVSSAITRDYADAEITKAQRGDDGTYKVKIKTDDGKSNLIYSAEGEFVKNADEDDAGLFENNSGDGGIMDNSGTDGATDQPVTPTDQPTTPTDQPTTY